MPTDNLVKDFHAFKLYKAPYRGVHYAGDTGYDIYYRDGKFFRFCQTYDEAMAVLANELATYASETYQELRAAQRTASINEVALRLKQVLKPTDLTAQALEFSVRANGQAAQFSIDDIANFILYSHAFYLITGHKNINLVEYRLPPTARFVEAYETEKEIIIMGDPDTADLDEHNCDTMGCGSLDHVIYRFAK